MREKIHKILNSDNLIIFLGVVTIIPLILLSFFNHASADDYAIAIKIMKSGYIRAQVDLYNNWSGRYFATAICSLHPLVIRSFLLYKCIPVVILILLFLSSFALIRAIFTHSGLKDVVLFTVFFLAVYLSQMPSVMEGIYWLPGTIGYQLANILTMLLFCSIMRLAQTNKILYLFLSLFFVFAVIGSNETSMLVIDLLLVLIFFANLFSARKLNYKLLIILLFAAICSVIVIIAPGNSIRGSYLAQKYQIIWSVAGSAYATVKYLSSWLPFATLAGIILAGRFYRKEHSMHVIFSMNPILSFMLMLCTIFACFFPSFWILGESPPLRTVNTIYFFFLLSWLYFLFTMQSYLRRKEIIFSAVPRKIRYVAGAALILCFCGMNNILAAYTDLLRGKAYRFDKELYHRYDLINESADDTVYVPVLRDRPSCLFNRDIDNDPDDWFTTAYAEYWKKKTIIADPR